MVSSFEFQILSFGFWGFGIWVLVLEFGVCGFGFRVLGFEVWVWVLGSWDSGVGF